MIRRPPRSTLDRSSAASDVYKRQVLVLTALVTVVLADDPDRPPAAPATPEVLLVGPNLSLIHISEPTRPY